MVRDEHLLCYAKGNAAALPGPEFYLLDDDSQVDNYVFVIPAELPPR